MIKIPWEVALSGRHSPLLCSCCLLRVTDSNTDSVGNKGRAPSSAHLPVPSFIFSSSSSPRFPGFWVTLCSTFPPLSSFFFPNLEGKNKVNNSHSFLGKCKVCMTWAHSAVILPSKQHDTSMHETEVKSDYRSKKITQLLFFLFSLLSFFPSFH